MGCMVQVGKLEADAAKAEQRALDSEQQLRDVTVQLHAMQEDQAGSSAARQDSSRDMQAQLEQQTSRAQAAEV